MPFRPAVLLLAAILPTLLAAIPDQPPPPLDVTASEASRLEARKVVVRTESTDSVGSAIGVIDIHADEHRVWASLLDFEARVPEIRPLKGVSIYDSTDSTRGVQWDLAVFGASVTFHCLYHLHPEKMWVRYALDASRPNDLVSVEGAYQIYSVGDSTRLIYRSATDSGRKVPEFIRNWLAVGSLSEQLEGVRDRAERGD